jgi:hypothetical protein
MEAGSPKGEQLRLLALKYLVNGIGALERSKKNFESYLDTLKKREDNLGDIEDFASVSDVSQEDTIEVIRSLNELILMMRASSPDEDNFYDEEELERKVVFKKKEN